LGRWLDLFKSFPSLAGRVPVEVFLQLVPLVHSRYYSIASSSDACPGEVHALVGRAQWTLADGTTRFGQCSEYITHLKPGDKVRFRIARVCSP
jgi:sulfite reductase (NADPH) flavoprotein alpha-component